MKRVAIIGGGVAGLTCGSLLNDNCHVHVYEKEPGPGGLIRCKRVEGSLFHLCGGHVFNTKDEDVSKWFWSRFDKTKDFVRKERKSAVCMADGSFVDYPIENHVYQLGQEILRKFYSDIEGMLQNHQTGYASFGEFLLKRFGKTLYELYFRPYNEKIWRRDLSDVPLSWLSGKLPMPTLKEMREANEKHLEERTFVHSSFYYPKKRGSQFIADGLARDLSISYNSPVKEIRVIDKICWVDGEPYDNVVFCGNVKEIPQLLKGPDLGGMTNAIEALESHGTTAVFCEMDRNPYTWIYQPSKAHLSHRIICSGNFSEDNNAQGKMTCTVEFTDGIVEADIFRQLSQMPYHPRYITSHYSQYSYPIQKKDSRGLIECLKSKLASYNVYLAGRFAEWEYYNMDAAIAAAMRCVRSMLS